MHTCVKGIKIMIAVMLMSLTNPSFAIENENDEALSVPRGKLIGTSRTGAGEIGTEMRGTGPSVIGNSTNPFSGGINSSSSSYSPNIFNIKLYNKAGRRNSYAPPSPDNQLNEDQGKNSNTPVDRH